MSEVVHESVALPGYWRVTSFGKLVENPRSAGPDLRIRTYVAPLVDPSTCPAHYGRIAGPLQPMLLPVGEIPRLHINAILKDGKLRSHVIKHLDREYIGARTLDCSRSNITVFDRYGRDERGELVIPLKPRWAQKDPERNAWFVAIGDDEDRYATIIPAVEIFRFFYATSDVVAKALLRGDFLDPNANLWDTKKTALMPDGRALLWLRKRMLDADARFLARFAFDAYALKEAQQIFLRASARVPPDGERMINALPPFQDTVTVRFRHVLPKDDSIHRVLVTRLLACDWKPPFRELKWDRDNDGRYDPDNREERSLTDWGPSLIALMDAANAEPKKLAVKAPSILNVPSRLREAEISERFPELGKVPAEKLPQENAESRAAARNWKVIAAEAYVGSVVEGRSSQDVIGKTVIEALEENIKDRGELTDAVNPYFGEENCRAVLQLLSAIRNHALADVDLLVVLKSAALVEGVSFNVFPESVGGQKKAWLYMDEDKEHRRMALVARIFEEPRTRYLIELQWRHEKECSTLIVWDAEEQTVPDNVLADVLLICATAGKAALVGAEERGLRWGRLHHTAKGDDKLSAKHFLARIFGAKPVIAVG